MGTELFKKWLLSSKKSLFSYIYWRIDKNWGLQCADLFFGDQGKNRFSRGEDLFLSFFFEDQGKNRCPRGEGFFKNFSYFGDQVNHWATKADSKVETFFFRDGGPQSYVPTAMVHRAMGRANFQNTKWPRFRKG